MDRQARAALRKELTRAEAESERLLVVIAYLRERLQEADQEDQFAPAAANGDAPEKATGPYAGMTSAKAAAKVLEARGKPMRTPDLFEEIKAGGAQIGGLDNLYRALKLNKRIVRVGRGNWALAEWPTPQDSLLAESEGG